MKCAHQELAKLMLVGVICHTLSRNKDYVDVLIFCATLCRPSQLSRHSAPPPASTVTTSTPRSPAREMQLVLPVWSNVRCYNKQQSRAEVLQLSVHPAMERTAQ